MNKVVFSSPGESQTFKRFTSQGTALPDSPSSRKTQSMQYPKQNQLTSSTSNINYGGSVKDGNRSISSSSKVKSSKQQKPPKSEDTQALLNQFQGSPTEYYKAKCKVLSSKGDQQELEIKQLKQDNEKLRNLNFDYVHQINLISHEKLRGLEKIVITSDVFDIENIEQKSVKEFVRKLANNYKIQEREQKKLINHCKVMEADIEVYKTKMKDADCIIDTLKASGATSISELMKQLEDLSINNKNLEQERSELTLNNAILKENIEKQTRLYEEVNGQYNETSEQLQDLKNKHNRIILDKEDDDQSNRKQIYQLKCKCDELEYQLRRYTQQMKLNKNEKVEAQIQNKELQMLNKTLANSAAGFYNAKKYLTTSNGFKFK